MSDVSSNYFELYGLPVKFQIDSGELAEKHRQLMAQYHPDRHVQSDAVTRRQAAQMAATVNESFRILKSRLSRAGYLLKLVGLDSKADNETSSDGAFLMLQMEIRETVEGAKNSPDPFGVLESAQLEANRAQEKLYQEFEDNYLSEEYEAARAIWVKLNFFTRLQGQIDKMERDLEDA